LGTHGQIVDVTVTQHANYLKLNNEDELANIFADRGASFEKHGNEMWFVMSYSEEVNISAVEFYSDTRSQSGHSGTSDCNLKVHIENDAHVSAKSISDFEDELSRIYRQIGVNLQLVNSGADYMLSIEPVGDAFTGNEHKDAVGQTDLEFAPGSPRRVIGVLNIGRVYVDRLSSNASNQSAPNILFHAALDHYLGVGLARAGAHEVGHYLLQLNGHTSGGIMNATFGGFDWFSGAEPSKNLWSFSDAQRNQIWTKLGGPQVPNYPHQGPQQ
jgi:hypothetical protein